MRRKKLKVVVQSIEGVKAPSRQAFQGKPYYMRPDGVLFFTSFAAVTKVLSSNRLDVLGAILKSKPDSVFDLAEIVERSFRSVFMDVRILMDMGMIESDSTKLVAKYNGIEINWQTRSDEGCCKIMYLDNLTA